MLPMNLRTAKNTRRGNVTVVVVVCITMLLGIVAIAMDGGLIQDNKRRIQNAADAAAIAAANKLFKYYPTIVSTGTADPGGYASSAAFNSTEHNGFKHNGNDTIVVVNIPPSTGPFKDKVGYVLRAQSSGDDEPEPCVDGSACPVPIGALPRAAGEPGIVGVQQVGLQRNHGKGCRLGERRPAQDVPDLVGSIRCGVAPPDLNRVDGKALQGPRNLLGSLIAEDSDQQGRGR